MNIWRYELVKQDSLKISELAATAAKSIEAACNMSLSSCSGSTGATGWARGLIFSSTGLNRSVKRALQAEIEAAGGRCVLMGRRKPLAQRTHARPCFMRLSMITACTTTVAATIRLDSADSRGSPFTHVLCPACICRYAADLSRQCTHLVVDAAWVQEHGGLSGALAASEKLRCLVADRSTWQQQVVSLQWLLACRQAGRRVDEAPYLLVKVSSTQSRVRLLHQALPCLAGLVFHPIAWAAPSRPCRTWLPFCAHASSTNMKCTLLQQAKVDPHASSWPFASGCKAACAHHILCCTSLLAAANLQLQAAAGAVATYSSSRNGSARPNTGACAASASATAARTTGSSSKQQQQQQHLRAGVVAMATPCSRQDGPAQLHSGGSSDRAARRRGAGTTQLQEQGQAHTQHGAGPRTGQDQRAGVQELQAAVKVDVAEEHSGSLVRKQHAPAAAAAVPLASALPHVPVAPHASAWQLRFSQEHDLDLDLDPMPRHVLASPLRTPAAAAVGDTDTTGAAAGGVGGAWQRTVPWHVHLSQLPEEEPLPALPGWEGVADQGESADLGTWLLQQQRQRWQHEGLPYVSEQDQGHPEASQQQHQHQHKQIWDIPLSSDPSQPQLQGPQAAAAAAAHTRAWQLHSSPLPDSLAGALGLHSAWGVGAAGAAWQLDAHSEGAALPGATAAPGQQRTHAAAAKAAAKAWHLGLGSEQAASQAEAAAGQQGGGALAPNKAWQLNTESQAVAVAPLASAALGRDAGGHAAAADKAWHLGSETERAALLQGTPAAGQHKGFANAVAAAAAAAAAATADRSWRLGSDSQQAPVFRTGQAALGEGAAGLPSRSWRLNAETQGAAQQGRALGGQVSDVEVAGGRVWQLNAQSQHDVGTGPAVREQQGCAAVLPSKAWQLNAQSQHDVGTEVVVPKQNGGAAALPSGAWQLNAQSQCDFVAEPTVPEQQGDGALLLSNVQQLSANAQNTAPQGLAAAQGVCLGGTRPLGKAWQLSVGSEDCVAGATAMSGQLKGDAHAAGKTWTLAGSEGDENVPPRPGVQHGSSMQREGQAPVLDKAWALEQSTQRERASQPSPPASPQHQRLGPHCQHQPSAQIHGWQLPGSCLHSLQPEPMDAEPCSPLPPQPPPQLAGSHRQALPHLSDPTPSTLVTWQLHGSQQTQPEPGLQQQAACAEPTAWQLSSRPAANCMSEGASVVGLGQVQNLAQGRDEGQLQDKGQRQEQVMGQRQGQGQGQLHPTWRLAVSTELPLEPDGAPSTSPRDHPAVHDRAAAGWQAGCSAAGDGHQPSANALFEGVGIDKIGVSLAKDGPSGQTGGAGLGATANPGLSLVWDILHPGTSCISSAGNGGGGSGSHGGYGEGEGTGSMRCNQGESEAQPQVCLFTLASSVCSDDTDDTQPPEGPDGPGDQGDQEPPGGQGEEQSLEGLRMVQWGHQDTHGCLGDQSEQGAGRCLVGHWVSRGGVVDEGAAAGDCEDLADQLQRVKLGQQRSEGQLQQQQQTSVEVFSDPAGGGSGSPASQLQLLLCSENASQQQQQQQGCQAAPEQLNCMQHQPLVGAQEQPSGSGQADCDAEQKHPWQEQRMRSSAKGQSRGLGLGEHTSSMPAGGSGLPSLPRHGEQVMGLGLDLRPTQHALQHAPQHTPLLASQPVAQHAAPCEAQPDSQPSLMQQTAGPRVTGGKGTAINAPDPSALMLDHIFDGSHLIGLDPDLDLPHPDEAAGEQLRRQLEARGVPVCMAREGQLGSGVGCVVCRASRAGVWLRLGCHVLSASSVARCDTVPEGYVWKGSRGVKGAGLCGSEGFE